MKLKRGSTSVRRLIFIADTSKTDGSGLANLAYNTSGLVAYYFAGDLANEVQISLATMTLGTWQSGGFVAVDNTNMPGWYEFGIPNEALDGGNEVAIQLRGAANMAPVNIYIELDAVDYQTAIPAQVWDAQYASYNIAGSFGKLMNTIRKANQLLEATVLASPAPSTTSFTVSGLNYPSGAFAGAVLLWDGGATLAEQNSPILSYVNNGDGTSLITVEMPFTSAPVAGDLALIIPTTHVHSVAEIQSGLSTLTAGQVNAQVLDVLTVDVFGELAAVPGASSTLKDKIAFLFMLARNKVTQTSSTQTLFADNTTTPVAAAATSDVGGTFTRGEFA